MCQCDEGRCGVAAGFRSFWDRFTAREPERFELPDDSDDPEEREHQLAVIHAEHVLRMTKQGRPLCSQCEALIEPDESALHPGWCTGCDGAYVDEQIIRPLVRRVGREATIRMLRRLVRTVQMMT
jgi:hypothetical protein